MEERSPYDNIAQEDLEESMLLGGDTESEDEELYEEDGGDSIPKDSVGWYLQETGKTPLLKPWEEPLLSLKIELGKRLEQWAQVQREDEFKEPASTIVALLKSMISQGPLLQIVIQYLGLSQNMTIRQIVEDPILR